MQEVAALKMRRNFGHYLDIVAKKKEHVLITRSNRPMVVMVPADEYRDEATDAARTAHLQKVMVSMDARRRRLARTLGKIDVVDAVRRTRARR